MFLPNDMTMKFTQDSPILVTGAAGDIGAIGCHLTAMLLAKGHQVRALVRREDERAEGLRASSGPSLFSPKQSISIPKIYRSTIRNT
jgi:nucleoside-diphosphate-sugar epimerase